jgi:hypothetical protein
MYEPRTRDPNLRASDADREAIGERLRQHHAEGRLDTEEFQQRIDACYQAKTIGELDQLLTDLPREEKERSSGRSWGRVPFWRWGPIPVIPILIAIIAISAITGHRHHGFWIVIPLFFLARIWLWRRGLWRWRRYGPDPGQRV